LRTSFFMLFFMGTSNRVYLMHRDGHRARPLLVGREDAFRGRGMIT